MSSPSLNVPLPPSPILDAYFSAAAWKEATAIEAACRANIGRMALISRDAVDPRSIHLLDDHGLKLATIWTRISDGPAMA